MKLNLGNFCKHLFYVIIKFLKKVSNDWKAFRKMFTFQFLFHPFLNSDRVRGGGVLGAKNGLCRTLAAKRSWVGWDKNIKKQIFVEMRNNGQDGHDGHFGQDGHDGHDGDEGHDEH